MAEADIRSIWDYIAADDPEAADRFVEALRSQMQALQIFPQRSPLIPESEILGVPYRHLIYYLYRTIFHLRDRVVYVMRVIHGARLLDASFLEL